MTEQVYQQLRKIEDPEIRQMYLDRIDLGPNGKYVSSVRYRPDICPWYDGRVISMQTAPDLRFRLGVKGLRSDIRVTERAFDMLKTEEDFLSALIDHELIHARQFAENPSFFPTISEHIGFAHHLIERYGIGAPDQPMARVEHSRWLRQRVAGAEIEAYKNQLMARKAGERNITEGFREGIWLNLSELLKLSRNGYSMQDWIAPNRTTR